VVEIFVKKGGYCRYTTIQNWAHNVYNLVTKRATCDANATMEWIDGNMGSKLTMKYPSVLLRGEGSRGSTISIALAGKGQNQDAGANIECDTLIMDDKSTSDTIPYNEIYNDNISLEHEAKVSKVSEEQLFYLMSRGLEEQEATDMIVMGFIEPFTRELPMEYAV